MENRRHEQGRAPVPYLDIPRADETLLVALVCWAAFGEDATTPGRLIIQEPTLICLGFEWHIKGDDNENCRVEVDYRAMGEQTWGKALPLFRAENRLYRNLYPVRRKGQKPRPYWKSLPETLSWGNKLAGSIFDLEPATQYEVRFRLKDADGGQATRTVKARTRPVPVAYARGRTLHVVPGNGGGRGTAQDPFRGAKIADEAARPGDIILLHEGVYPGPLVVTRDGEPGKPIVWRGVSAAKAVVDGGGAKSAEKIKVPVVDLRRRRHVYLDSVTVRNGAWGVRLECGSDLVVRRCVIDNCDVGVSAWDRQSFGKRFLICDNIIRGRKRWGMGHGPKAAKDVIGLEGIVPTGDGHVLCHNYIEGFSDGISFGNTHIQEDGTAKRDLNYSIDVYGNEVVTCLDDGIEADWGRSNVRVFRNRVTNALKGFSCQPTFGGPVYFIRNACVNVSSFLKFHCEPSGMVMYHNTAFTNRGWAGGEWHNAVTRNNIIASASYACIQTRAHKADLDYDGFIPSPKYRRMFHFGRTYDSLADFRKGTGMEQHGLQLALADFARAALVDYEKTYDPGALALTLNPKGMAVDAGIVLPNVNDGFAGKAPDLGCYEAGHPIPRYGPRPVSPNAP